jgi:hypothetical protein
MSGPFISNHFHLFVPFFGLGTRSFLLLASLRFLIDLASDQGFGMAFKIIG